MGGLSIIPLSVSVREFGSLFASLVARARERRRFRGALDHATFPRVLRVHFRFHFRFFLSPAPLGRQCRCCVLSIFVSEWVSE